MGTRLKTAGENIVWFTTSTLEAKSPRSDKSSMRTFFVLILKVFYPRKNDVCLRQKGITTYKLIKLKLPS